MSIARPAAGTFFVRVLIAFALVVFAVAVMGTWLGPSRPGILLPEQQTQSRPNHVVVDEPSTQVRPWSPPSAGTGAQAPGSTGPAEGVPARPGVTRFADGGPDVVGGAPAAAESTQTCSVKCPPQPAR